MYDELKGKRLLVLGGTAWADILFAFAKENDIQLITTGKEPNKAFDEYYYVDSTDSENMKKLIKEKKIDGVYIGSNEQVIRQATKYLEDLGMPCYCTQKQWDTLMNKRKFKQLCIKFGLPVAHRYNYTPDTPCHIDYPVITKPADGCASLGIKICNNENELLDGYRFAYDNSVSREVLVEKLVNNTGMDVFYQITNSNIEFCCLGDKYPIQLALGAGSVAGARILPSLYTKEFREKFETKIKKMFEFLGLSQGLIWMEVFHDGVDYYFNEVGYRPNGSLTIIGIDYLKNINTVAADIYFALTGKGKAKGFSSLILKEHKKGKKKVCEYWIAVKDGVIGDISGIEEVRNNESVLAAFPKYEIGSTVPLTNGFAQNFCVIHFAYNDVQELSEIIGFINRTVKVNDINGNDMIIHKDDAFNDKLLADN